MVWFREKAFVILWAPMSCALLTALLFRGRAGLWTIIRRFDPRHVRLHWWAVALLLPVGVHLLSLVLSGAFEERSVSATLMIWMAAFAMLFFLFAGEEVGWRGYALPALQARFTPFRASVILGLLWGVWHYPVWFGIGYGSSGAVSAGVIVVVLNAIGIIALALVMTWLTNRTGGCILILMLYHGSNNSVLRAYGSAEGPAAFLASTAVIIVIAAIVVTLDRETFFRKPLAESH